MNQFEALTTAYPNRDINKAYKTATIYCRWLSGRPWWGTDLPLAEGGWDSFRYTATLYALEGGDLRSGLQEYGRLLIAEYRYDTETESIDKIVEDIGAWTAFDGQPRAEDMLTIRNYAGPAESVEDQALRALSATIDIVPLEGGASEAAFALGDAAEAQPLYRNVIIDILQPPYSDDAIDALQVWANTRSYKEAAEIVGCNWEEIRHLIQQIGVQVRNYDTPEDMAKRYRSAAAHSRYHKDAPSRWCFYCS